MSQYCPDCGTKLPDKLKFCINCGHKLPAEPVFASEAPSSGLADDQAAAGGTFPQKMATASSPRAVSDMPRPAADGTAGKMGNSAAASPAGAHLQGKTPDSRAENILKYYGTKRMLLRKLPFVLVMLGLAIFFAVLLSDEKYYSFLSGLISAPILAFMMWRVYRQPARYNIKREKALLRSGYSPAEAKKILSQNPIFGGPGAVEPDRQRKLASLGRWSYIIGMLFWLYGLFAVLLPIVSEAVVPHDFNYDLFIKGLHIFAIGMLIGYVGKILKGAART